MSAVVLANEEIRNHLCEKLFTRAVQSSVPPGLTAISNYVKTDALRDNIYMYLISYMRLGHVSSSNCSTYSHCY